MHDDSVFVVDTDLNSAWASSSVLLSPLSVAEREELIKHSYDSDSDSHADLDKNTGDVHYDLANALAANQALKDRFYKRSLIIDEIKSSYLRDVVAMKNVIKSMFTDVERAAILKEWQHTLPSLDLRQGLALYAPEQAHLKVKPCKKCGGHLDIEQHNSAKTIEMEKKLEKMSQRNEELRLQLANKQYSYDKLENQFKELDKTHNQEVSLPI